jgi:SAM-dependent methyltransferase
MSPQHFEQLLQDIRQGDSLMSATLSSPRIKEQITTKISLRPVTIKARLLYQLSEYHNQQVTHRNLNPEECAVFIEKSFQDYNQGIFSLKHCQYHVLVNKKQEMTVLKKATSSNTAPPSLPLHNRMKNYVLQEGIPIPFLVSLGIMSPNGKVIAKKYDKFRQINRFLEMVRDIIDHLPVGRPLEIVDFGCGKAYLTFALHYYLTEIEKREVHLIGLDLKQDAINQCQTLAKTLNLKGLIFLVGDIKDFQSHQNVDLMISLHACDTATDAALEKAVRWNAEVILCVPCCQHELYSQVDQPQLNTLLRHGILKERFAALATDAARAELLTFLGYEVQILEFIDMEHTPKNLLLRGVKGISEDKRQMARERYLQFKAQLKITPSLEKRIEDSLRLP